ncbi:hypothetical protein HNY73_004786 [Argiope bruennichi]|uniref:Uncharacterized protein n=1 Tax=Argiope bruennichi TaxID=94029 RepID=A0A8T0FUQ7_ARGBR|nr:hypothetical protein HNY73_004786 [Argiope bruennichi]
MPRLQGDYSSKRDGDEDSRPGIPPQMFHVFQVPRGPGPRGQVPVVGGSPSLRQRVSEALQAQRQSATEKSPQITTGRISG